MKRNQFRLAGWRWNSARWYIEGRTVGVPIQWVDCAMLPEPLVPASPRNPKRCQRHPHLPIRLGLELVSLVGASAKGVAAAFLILACMGCDGRQVSKGFVFDQRGRPVEGATVHQKSGTAIDETRTASNGGFYVVTTIAALETITVTVSAIGYAEKSMTVRSGDSDDLIVVLAPIESEPETEK